MAGDLLFYDPRSDTAPLGPATPIRSDTGGSCCLSPPRAYWGVQGTALVATLLHFTPGYLRAAARSRRNERRLTGGDMNMLQPAVARRYLATKRSTPYLDGERVQFATDQLTHASNFTTGLISFAHELAGSLALANRIEPRSPFSDRRVIEFAVRMPLEAKLATPSYKQLLREGTAEMLPESVRLRRDIGVHPGWTFYERLIRNIAKGAPELWNNTCHSRAIKRWVNPAKTQRYWETYAGSENYDSGYQAYRLLVLAKWLSLTYGW